MNIAETNISTKTRILFDTICEEVVHTESSKILMAHFGIISQDFINSLSEGVEELLISCNEKRALIKRIFSIFIEGLQNIKLHGELFEDGLRRGILIFAQNESRYKICLGNVIKNERIEAMTLRLNELNSRNDAETKALYMDVLSNGILSNKGGAGLGFITMKLKSKSKMNDRFYPLTESLSLFFVEMEVLRSSVDEPQ
jgi:hypothetical protein